MRRLLTLILLALSFTAHADIVLREDTASQIVMVGPFVDSTDGATLETGLTIDAADVLLSKNGAAFAAKNSGGCTAASTTGYYACTFNATDSDTAGRLQVIVNESGALPVYHEFQVATQSVYDACCASGATAPATDGSDFTAIPWNASWDAEVQSEAADALNAYDPPTNAELTARTLASASYATAATQSTMDGKLDTISTAVVTTIPAAVAVIDGIVDQLLVGVNITSINDVTITGDGSGTPFTVSP